MEFAMIPISCGLATDSSSQGMGNQTRGRIAIVFGASSASKLRYPRPERSLHGYQASPGGHPEGHGGEDRHQACDEAPERALAQHSHRVGMIKEKSAVNGAMKVSIMAPAS